ncbi:MAG TPA: isochorismatase family protein [Usitatibacter sp.]|nr:isochorismatase family protein [Usitatibacter sp.]
MPVSFRLDRDRSQLLLVDIQERLAPHVEGHEALVARCDALLEAARMFGIPKTLTEHCPGDIGPAVARLRARFADGEIFAKTRFGATDHPHFASQFVDGRSQVVVAGMEAHVCVMQTALGLAATGLQVFVVEDAVGSRAARAEDRRLALLRMREAGCTLLGTETVLFEWARAGDDPAFRDTLRLVKALP